MACRRLYVYVCKSGGVTKKHADEKCKNFPHERNRILGVVERY